MTCWTREISTSINTGLAAACRQVAAVSRQMDAASARLAVASRSHRQRVAAEVAAARHRLATLQQRLSRQVDLLSTRLAPQLCNSLSISSAGQVRAAPCTCQPPCAACPQSQPSLRAQKAAGTERGRVLS